MAVDDLLADPEAEPGAGDSLGGEEGVVDFGLGFGAHAGGVVGDGEGDAGLAGAPVGGFAFADEEAAAVGHDVERVADEVGEDLANLAVEAVDFAAAAAAALDLNVGVGDAALVDGQDGVEEVGDADLLRAGGLAVEAQGLAGDGGGAAELDLGGVEVAAGFVEGVGDLGEIDEVGDGFEGVVDLVGDGAGEAADDGQLFALDEGLLGLLLLRDFERGGADGLDAAVGSIDGKVADGPVAVVAGIGDEGSFERVVDDGRAGDDLIEELFEAGDGSHLGEGAADDLLGFEAEEGGLAVVEAEVAIVLGIEEREADGSGAIDGLELGVLALGFVGLALQGFAVELLGGEVAEEDDDAIVGGIALDAQPDVERLGIEGFEFGGKAFVHAEAIAFYVGRAFVDGGGEGLRRDFPRGGRGPGR